MKKKISSLLAIACVASLVVGSLALFTDRIQANTEATAGTLDLDLNGSFLASKTSNFKPGESIDVTYTLSNEGNKSADVKEILVLTVDKKLTDTSGVAELELYTADGNAVLATDTKRVFAASDNKTTITYYLDEFILNGTGTGAEIDVPDVDGVDESVKAGAFKIVFATGSASNALQGAVIKLDYLAQGKQHRNTNADTWETLVVANDVTLANSGLSFDAVPAK